MGGTRTRLYYSRLCEFSFPFPSVEEQEQIVDLFDRINETIANQEQYVAALETQKKELLRQVFAREIRFKDENGQDYPEWVYRKTVDCCSTFIDGDWIESKDQSDEGIRLIQTGNVGNGFYVGKEARKRYVSEGTFARLNCNEVFPGDVLISRLPSPAGRSCIVPDTGERMITAVDCTIVRTIGSVLNKVYYHQFMQSSRHFAYVDSMLAGGTRQRISRSNLEEEQIPVPSLPEQQRIADFFTALDAQIENERALLEDWRQLKNGLLQQMFI